jgi:hypothetical protein
MLTVQCPTLGSTARFEVRELSAVRLSDLVTC